MRIPDQTVANLRMFLKRLAAVGELARLRYYKRSPLEREALACVARIYRKRNSLAVLFRSDAAVAATPDELLNLWHHARVMADHGGQFAEVGVFNGTSATAIAAAKGAAAMHLFDTFEGLPRAEIIGRRFTQGMFKADEEKVRRELSAYPNIHIHRGTFPQSGAAIRNLSFSLVHIDVDLHESTGAALEFFYPRMLTGGRIILHDYSRCESVWRAVDEFMREKPEPLEPIGTTQALIIKS